VLVGAFVWLAALKSGIHPTVAGAVLGLMTPAGVWIAREPARDLILGAGRALAADPVPSVDVRQEVYAKVEFAAREARAPMERLESALHPWVGFLIMPIFALANAGLPLADSDFASPGALAVTAGLVLGKPLGFLLAAVLVVRLGLGRLPGRVTWSVMSAAGCLAGIGFTMSLFVASLAFDGRPLLDAKSGVLLGSLVSGVLGMALLARALPRRADASSVPPGPWA
jgi:NhaA family Na+:H+ antiporter